MTHPAVSIYGVPVTFYAGHVVLDAHGGAYLDDGSLKVRADRIVLDLRANRYVAIGNVQVCAAACRAGVAFGEDLVSRRGTLVQLGPAPARIDIAGTAWNVAAGLAPAEAVAAGLAPAESPAGPAPATVGTRPTATLDEPGPTATLDEPGPTATLDEPRSTTTLDEFEPLALPDLGGEEPFARALGAVAHLGADVRLRAASVVVPSARSVFLPSYVYTFSSSPGYVLTNVAASNEDIPWYVGSTRNSILGLHFFYDPRVKVGIGIDEHIVDGDRAYVLLSLAPLLGPAKIGNLTWQQQINEHASQTVNSSVIKGFGTANRYDLRDGIHRSFLELTANQQPSVYAGQLAWQSFDQALTRTGLGSSLFFHLRSEYGLTHIANPTPFFPFPENTVVAAGIYHTAYEAYVATAPLNLNRSTTLNLSADARKVFDTLPHTQMSETYGANLSHRWNRFVTTTLSDTETPVIDGFPSLGAGISTRFSAQTLSVFYNHSDQLSFVLTGLHAAARTDGTQFAVAPWVVSADVRFRLNPSLSLELSRAYFFGFEGQRFGSWSIQIFP